MSVSFLGVSYRKSKFYIHPRKGSVYGVINSPTSLKCPPATLFPSIQTLAPMPPSYRLPRHPDTPWSVYSWHVRPLTASQRLKGRNWPPGTHRLHRCGMGRHRSRVSLICLRSPFITTFMQLQRKCIDSETAHRFASEISYRAWTNVRVEILNLFVHARFLRIIPPLVSKILS